MHTIISCAIQYTYISLNKETCNSLRHAIQANCTENKVTFNPDNEEDESSLNELNKLWLIVMMVIVILL